MNLLSLSAAGKYTAARSATQPSSGDNPAAPFLKEAAQDFAATLRAGEDTAKAAMAGRADPHALVHALAQTELAVETAVTLRNKVVEAYQEILRMPV